MADIFGIGTSGLLTYQRALSTTSHNIANVNTDGYSRQTVTTATRTPQFIGVGFVGSGVTVTGVKRNYDAFLGEQVQKQTSSFGSFEAFHTLSSQIDNLLADPLAGLTPVMEDFFNAAQGVADNPASVPARQVMMTSAQSFADRFHYIDQRLRDVNGQANRQLEVGVEELNALARSLGDLNVEIAAAFGSSGGASPNDLLDRRDLLLKQMSSLVNINTIQEPDGQVNVFIGSGQSLVVGSSVTQLAVAGDPLIPDARRILISNGAAGIDVTNFLGSGTIGGTAQFLNDVLVSSRNALGRVAVGVTDAVNSQHNMGLDLADQLGGDFFQTLQPSVLISSANTAVGQPTVAYDNIAGLTGSDYLLVFDGATWNLSNYQTGAAVPWTVGSGTPADPYIVDGISVDLTSIGPAAAGDRFLLRPTSEASRAFDLKVSDPSKIAAASALRGVEAADVNGLPLNGGTSSLTNLSYSDISSIPLPGSITLTYDAALQQFNVAGAVPAVIAYNPTVDNGVTQTLTVGTMSIDFAINGTPQNGDQLVIEDNNGAEGDNRNMLLIANLVNQKTLNNGSASFHDAYGQMISSVGTQTHQASINMDATQTLLNQATDALSQVAGVNLDEEAANLIKFQQAYEATAKVISTANQLFQTLLNSF